MNSLSSLKAFLCLTARPSALMFRIKLLLLVLFQIFFSALIASCFSFHYMAFVLYVSSDKSGKSEFVFWCSSQGCDFTEDTQIFYFSLDSPLQMLLWPTPELLSVHVFPPSPRPPKINRLFMQFNVYLDSYPYLHTLVISYSSCK